MNYGFDRGSRGLMMGGGLSNAVRMIIAWNIIFFLVQFMSAGLLSPLLLSRDGVMHGKIWQLATYMFLHGGPFHLIINMLILWMFGSELEHLWGTRRFVKYYFFTGVGAGIVTVLTSASPTLGASGAIFGILLAYGLTFPDRPVLLYFLFPIKAKYFVIILGLIDLFAALSGSNDNVAHTAHLGGLLFGWVYLKGVPGLGLYQNAKRERQKKKFRVIEFKDPDRDNDSNDPR